MPGRGLDLTPESAKTGLNSLNPAFGVVQGQQAASVYSPCSPTMAHPPSHQSPQPISSPAVRRPLEAQFLVNSPTHMHMVLQRKQLMRRFGEHQIKVCEQFDILWQELHNPLQREAIVQKEECDKVFERIRPIAALHQKLLMELAKDSDHAAIHNSVPKFAAIIDGVFREMQVPFNHYLDGFNQIFQTLTLWKATNAEFASFLEAIQSQKSRRIAELLALPLVCLKEHQEHLEAFRLTALGGEEEAFSVGSAIQNIRNLRSRMDLSISDLISVENRMAILAATEMAGATISIVKLGRTLIHSGPLTSHCINGTDVSEFKEMEGFLLSDILLACENSDLGLVVKSIVDLGSCDFELTNGDLDGQPIFGFSLSCPGNRGTKANVFFLPDEFQRNIWVMRLQQVRSSVVAAGESQHAKQAVTARDLKYHKELLLECGLYAESDTTEEGLHATSDSGSWDVEDVDIENLSDEDCAGPGADADRCSGLTAENEDFGRILNQKLLAISAAQNDEDSASDLDPEAQDSSDQGFILTEESMVSLYGADLSGPPAPPGSFGSLNEMMFRPSLPGEERRTSSAPTNTGEIGGDTYELDFDFHSRMVLRKDSQQASDSPNAHLVYSERRNGTIPESGTTELLQSTESGFTTCSQASTLHCSMDMPLTSSSKIRTGHGAVMSRSSHQDQAPASESPTSHSGPEQDDFGSPAHLFRLSSEDADYHDRWSGQPWTGV